MPDGLERIPTNMEEIEQLFLEKMDDHQNGDLFYLIWAGTKMNWQSSQENKKLIKFLIPVSIAALGVFVTIIVALFGG